MAPKNSPLESRPFYLEFPEVDKSGGRCKLHTRSKRLLDIGLRFEAVTYTSMEEADSGIHIALLWFSPLYDIQYAWLMLLNQLAEASKFEETWNGALDDALKGDTE